MVFCARRAKEGKDLERKVSAGGGTALFVRCDVSKEKEVRALVDGTVARFGRIDCLINNAGWHPPHRPIDDFTAEDFRDLLELNLVSMFVACQQALPYLRKTKGNIINLSSLVGSMGQLHATTYVATKGAITAFSKALAIDEAVNGVRVNSVSPGNIWTPLWKQAVDASANKAKTRLGRRPRPAPRPDGDDRGGGPAVPVPGRRRHVHDGRRPHPLGRRRARVRAQEPRELMAGGAR